MNKQIKVNSIIERNDVDGLRIILGSIKGTQTITSGKSTYINFCGEFYDGLKVVKEIAKACNVLGCKHRIEVSAFSL